MLIIKLDSDTSKICTINLLYGESDFPNRMLELMVAFEFIRTYRNNLTGKSQKTKPRQKPQLRLKVNYTRCKIRLEFKPPKKYCIT